MGGTACVAVDVAVESLEEAHSRRQRSSQDCQTHQHQLIPVAKRSNNHSNTGAGGGLAHQASSWTNECIAGDIDGGKGHVGLVSDRDGKA